MISIEMVEELVETNELDFNSSDYEGSARTIIDLVDQILSLEREPKVLVATALIWGHILGKYEATHEMS